MEKHFTILGVLYVALSIGALIGAVVVLITVGAGGLISGDPEAIAVTTPVALLVAGFLFLLAAPGVIGGIGLLKRKSWSRILLLILGVLNLFNLPLGTALGIYTFWVLLKDESVRLLSSPRSS